MIICVPIQALDCRKTEICLVHPLVGFSTVIYRFYTIIPGLSYASFLVFNQYFRGLLESITVTLKSFTIPTRMLEKHLHASSNMASYLYMMSSQAILSYNTSLKLFYLTLQSSLTIVWSCKTSNYIREN